MNRIRSKKVLVCNNLSGSHNASMAIDVEKAIGRAISNAMAKGSLLKLRVEVFQSTDVVYIRTLD